MIKSGLLHRLLPKVSSAYIHQWKVHFSILFLILLYQYVCHTPGVLCEASGGHTWVFDWVLTGTCRRGTFWACLQRWGKPPSLGGSAAPQSPATTRHPSCSTAHSDHSKGHWRRKHREGLRARLCPMMGWTLSLTWGSRGLFLEQLWSAAAARGFGCDSRAPAGWATQQSAWIGCLCTPRGESWQPTPSMPSLVHCI